MIRAMRSGRYDRAISEISGTRARAQGDRWEIGALWGTRVMAVDVVAAWMGGWRSGGGGMGRARARGDRAAIRGVSRRREGGGRGWRRAGSDGVVT